MMLLTYLELEDVYETSLTYVEMDDFFQPSSKYDKDDYCYCCSWWDTIDCYRIDVVDEDD